MNEPFFVNFILKLTTNPKSEIPNSKSNEMFFQFISLLAASGKSSF